ncbi:Hypothetical protein RAK1035_1322 [Roseovarius sp. AK1035]|nr:Hypothetical protein RAK1035_1322 [Roseovarius sp. AK1035]
MPKISAQLARSARPIARADRRPHEIRPLARDEMPFSIWFYVVFQLTLDACAG